MSHCDRCDNGRMAPESEDLADSLVSAFWRAARASVPSLPEEPPTADRVWGFGATPEHADELLALVLAGIKTGTAGYLEQYEAEGAETERVGDLDVILDGSGAPRAIIETTAVTVIPFDDVSEAHAFSEGEDDRTLSSWRRIHRDFYEKYIAPSTPFRGDIPIICQRFRLVHPPITKEE